MKIYLIKIHSDLPQNFNFTSFILLVPCNYDQ